MLKDEKFPKGFPEAKSITLVLGTICYVGIWPPAYEKKPGARTAVLLLFKHVITKH